VFNYSFTISHSPFGPVYLKSIQRKLRDDTRSGVFIVAVDPWSVSTEGDPDDSTAFFEKELALGTTRFVNMSPNIDYLLHSYSDPYINLFTGKKPDGVFLHEDGWLEISADMDSVSVGNRLRTTLENYQSKLKTYRFSEVRWRYLIKTIEDLRKYGEVYMVRLPVHEDIYRIDETLMPECSRKLSELAGRLDVPFFDLTADNGRYAYVDGNHLHKTSSLAVSSDIAERISIQKKGYE
jgi:hypothetical protein